MTNNTLKLWWGIFVSTSRDEFKNASYKKTSIAKKDTAFFNSFTGLEALVTPVNLTHGIHIPESAAE